MRELFCRIVFCPHLCTVKTAGRYRRMYAGVFRTQVRVLLRLKAFSVFLVLLHVMATGKDRRQPGKTGVLKTDLNSDKMAYKKIDREFCLTDDSVNVYGYRLLTSGLLLERFCPAIGFLMHNRERGVAVRWEDFRIEQGCLYAKPVVNESAFPELAQQIEDGFYSAASVGHIVAIEMSDDPKKKLEGQTGVTVTKWFPRECSIVDIPGNYNAISKLYDEADNVLHDLSDNINRYNNMNRLTIEPAALGLPNLADNATVDDIKTAIADLAAKAGQADRLQQELDDLKSTTARERIDAALKKGLDERRLTKELADRLRADYADNAEALETLVASMPRQTIVTTTLAATDVPSKYQGKTWRDLYLTGELADIKKNYPDLYDKLKNEKE